jgi:hypothetical protein
MSRPGFSRRADVAARRARVLALRVEQVPYARIAAELGITESAARVDYTRALEQARADLGAHAHVARALEQAKLDAMERAAWQVLRNRHITIQHGKIVRDEDDQVVADDAPVLQALDRLVRISARRGILTGGDAPARIEVSDATDAAIRALAAELAAGVGAVEPGGKTEAAGDAEARGVSTPSA